MRSGFARQTVSTLVFTLACSLFALVAVRLHYTLPTPLVEEFNAAGVPVFSEARGRRYIEDLSTFPDGSPRYRILGTSAMDECEDYLMQQLEAIKLEIGNKHEVEIWRQKGSGSHVFDIMGELSNKKYTNITNIVVRLSSGGSSKNNAVLVNAHTDSTVPSPGAADDLAGVAVMLEGLRVLGMKEKKLENSVVFLFNGGEESLQDASHLFSTQFDKNVIKSLRSVINLEACGNHGPEIVFQANSEEMIRALARTPYPYASTVASEIFASGVMLSDTDFRIFDAYANLTGLDMALVQNSYHYHTRLDSIEHLERGSLQHMGENTLALLEYLTSNETTLGKPNQSGPLPRVAPSSFIFASFLGGKVFVHYSRATASLLYGTLVAVSAIVVAHQVDWSRKSIYAIGVASVLLSFVSAGLAANLVAYLTGNLMNKSMVWFRHESIALVMFGIPAIIGALLAQLAAARFMRCPGLSREDQSFLIQHSILIGQLIVFSSGTALGHSASIGSVFWLALSTTSHLIVLILNGRGPIRLVWLILGQASPLLLGTAGFIGFIDIVVPLTGRLGLDAPVDHIVATVVALVGFLCVPMILPFSHRHSESGLIRLILLFVFISAGSLGYLTRPASQPYDALHPQRLFALYLENITETIPVHHLHIARMDVVSNEQIVLAAAKGLVDVDSLEIVKVEDYAHEWEVVYPISEFLAAYKIPLPVATVASNWKDRFTVKATRSVLNAPRSTRELEIEIRYPDLIWPAFSFEAEVVTWEFPAVSSNRSRHHVKGENGYGVDLLTLSMTIRLNEEEFKAAMRQDQRAKGQRGDSSSVDSRLGLRIDFSALDIDGMWPASAKPNAKTSKVPDGEGGAGVEFYKKFEKGLPAHVDAMLLSAVAGVVYL